MYMVDVKGKSKRGLVRLVFGRSMFVILFTLIQIMTIVWLFMRIDDRYRAYGYGAMAILGAILAIRILNEKQNASFKMAWLVPVLLFPVFGGLFYMFVQLQLETKILAKRISDIHSRTKHYLPQNQAIFKKLKKESRSNSNMARFLFECGGFPIYEDTNFKYYPLGELFYEDMMLELKNAKQFIFLEYFIIQPGMMWDSILKVLEEKAAEGVEVRVLYDGMNAFSNLPHDYPKELKEKGIQCRIFNPIRPAVS
ncbi:MAG: PLDc N-terminal domain-containing protein, partial [Lachnospiraceae bacterium]|nr:PLDc N-terminal domain-containing protein [Lachnospiraceae bacterium]